MGSVLAACSAHSMHVSFRWSVHIFIALSCLTGLIWLLLCLMYSYIIVFIPGSCFSRHNIYVGSIIILSGPFYASMSCTIYHVLYFSVSFYWAHHYSLYFVISTSIGMPSPASLRTCTQTLKDNYIICRSHPLSYCPLSPHFVYVSLSLWLPFSV